MVFASSDIHISWLFMKKATTTKPEHDSITPSEYWVFQQAVDFFT